VLVNTGVMGTSALDGIVVAMTHLRGLRLRPPMLGQPGPQRTTRTQPTVITPGHHHASHEADFISQPPLRSAESARRAMSPAAHRSSSSAFGRRQLGTGSTKANWHGEHPGIATAHASRARSCRLAHMPFFEPAGPDLGGPAAAQGPAGMRLLPLAAVRLRGVAQRSIVPVILRQIEFTLELIAS
jgi:hypothetical protein